MAAAFWAPIIQQVFDQCITGQKTCYKDPYAAPTPTPYWPGAIERDVSSNEAIFRFNTLDSPNVIDSFRDRVMVWATKDPNNNTAIFGFADEQHLGRLSGYPTLNDVGVMQGNFSIPGLDDNQEVGGEWISVVPSVAAEKTLCAFEKAKELVAAGEEISAVSLDGMLDDLEAAHC